jgi:multiple antibiotic resistance protein
MLEYTEYTKMFIGLLAIVNPIGAVPIVVAMTSGANDVQRSKITRIVVFSVFTILLSSMLFGELLLGFFGISIYSFRVGGGILILLVAISMLHARLSATVQTPDEVLESEARESVAVVPISIPLLAGPGAISTVILYAHKGSGVVHHLLVCVDILFLAVVLWAIFQLIPWISRHLSQTAINISTRIMGLILSAIAIEFIANGLKGLFPALA